MGNMNMGAMLGMVNNPMLGMGMAGVRPGVNGFGMAPCMLTLSIALLLLTMIVTCSLTIVMLSYQVGWVWA